MIEREITPILKKLSELYPVVSLTGPRQSGKSTLLMMAFGDYAYISLEDTAYRNFASSDPKGFLEKYNDKTIIDEAQYAPDLFSYIQLAADKANKPGQYILSGSQNFLLAQNISQSLAGRVGIATLLPFSFRELSGARGGMSLDEAMFTGGYPRIYDMNIPPELFYSDYIDTYLDKDVNTLLKIREISAFRRFLQLIAIRVGGELNLSTLSRDAGVAVSTVNSWLSVLQASYIVYLLQPYYNNLGKRLTKSPKLYFYDTGLLCGLIGIESDEALTDYAGRGKIFENFIIGELIKNCRNARKKPKLYYWRDNNKNEVDLIDETGGRTRFYEIKSTRTGRAADAKAVNAIGALAGVEPQNRSVIYNGDDSIKINGVSYETWRDFITGG
jgi:predicted AAA+ superfamily ATPase